MKINNKIKKFFGGNWSTTKWIKKHTKIPDPMFSDVPRYKKKTKKKKVKRVWRRIHESCPFCSEALKAKQKKEEDLKGFRRFSIFDEFEKKCDRCGAHEVPGCPACQGKTWYKDKIYKHQYMGCGFVGERLKNEV